jgi:NADH:ubiquinone reductase (H+-translocating)
VDARCRLHGRVHPAPRNAVHLVRPLANVALDRAGRVPVFSDLSLPGRSEVFALGDMVVVQDPRGTVIPLPGLAPVAMQQGRYVARAIRARLQKRTHRRSATGTKEISRPSGGSKGVADVHGGRVAGFAAWTLWLFVHLFYLIGFQNRQLVFIRWTISFATRGRGARLIVQQERRPHVMRAARPALTTRH